MCERVQSLPSDFTNLKGSLAMLRMDGAPLCVNGYLDQASDELRNMITEKRACGCTATCSVWHLDDTICHDQCNNAQCGFDHLPGEGPG